MCNRASIAVLLTIVTRPRNVPAVPVIVTLLLDITLPLMVTWRSQWPVTALGVQVLVNVPVVSTLTTTPGGSHCADALEADRATTHAQIRPTDFLMFMSSSPSAQSDERK